MVEQQHGLFNRGLEPWDVEECESPVLEALLKYTASMGMMLFEQNKLQCRRVCVGIFFCNSFTDCCSQIDTLTDMASERDEAMFKMQWTFNDQEDELHRLSCHLRNLTEDLWDLHHQVPPSHHVDHGLDWGRPQGDHSGREQEPLMVRTVVRIERGETVVPDSEAGTLVEIQEDRRATPQIVGEAERAFERMERGGLVEQRAWDKEANYVAWGTVAPEYE